MHFPTLEPSAIGTFRCVVAEPASCANEAEMEATSMTSAKTNCIEMFDIGKFHNEIQ